ncbi:MAG: tryptophan 2,3-dioxygenase family protein [Myxococcota bacterium]
MTKTDYEKYIRTDELFELMRPVDGLVTHDELLFQVTHQTAELWMKVVMHDVRSAIALMEENQLVEAANRFERAANIEAHMTRQLEILERMPPKEYVAIRRTLGKGSGQESPGFNELLGMGELIWPPLEATLKRRKLEIVEVLEAPYQHAEVHTLLRSLFELDQWFRSFRFAHFRLVERQIGAFVDSLKGAPAELLSHGMREHLLPELWAAVNQFTRQIKDAEGV